MLNILKIGCQYLLGLIFLVFGLNGFIEFFPIQDGLNPKALTFITTLQNIYLFKLIKSIEVICGVLLLSGQFIPLALCCLAPIILNIFLFHFFLEPGELLVGFALLFLEIILILFNFKHFKSLLSRK